MGRKTVRQRGLFGGFMPPPRDPRGRPPIVWNAEAAETVAKMAARAATQDDIAQAVDLSVKTLVRIYADELSRGAEIIRQAVFDAQVSQALKGSSSAAKFVAAELDKVEVEDIAYRPRAAAPSAEPRLGKKEERQRDAEDVGGIFAPTEPPSNLVTH